MTTSLRWIHDCITFKQSRFWPPQRPQRPEEPVIFAAFTLIVFAWMIGVRL